MPYIKQTWIDENLGYTLSAARMAHLEDGIYDVSESFDNHWRGVFNEHSGLGGATAGFYLMRAETFVSNASNVAHVLYGVYLHPSDFALVGRTTKMRVRWTLITNATAPSATTYTFGLYGPTSSGSITGTTNIIHTMGSAVAGSTYAVTAPAAQSVITGLSSEFNQPTAGVYTFGVAITGATMTGRMDVIAQLQRRYE